jgi:hypothetical protein
MGAQTLGIAIVKADGQAFVSEPGASIDIGGVTRTPIKSDQPGVVKFSQQVKESQVDLVIMMDSDTKLDDIRNMSDVTIEFDCDTGQSYVIDHAFLQNPPKATAGAGGKIPLTFIGPPAQEQGA